MMQRPKTDSRRLIALIAATAAVATGTLWYERNYPAGAVGTYVGYIEGNTSPIRVTLRPGGSGYLKLYDLPEQTVTWSGDRDRILIHADSMWIARRISNEELDVDFGAIAPLYRVDPNHAL